MRSTNASDRTVSCQLSSDLCERSASSNHGQHVSCVDCEPRRSTLPSWSTRVQLLDRTSSCPWSHANDARCTISSGGRHVCATSRPLTTPVPVISRAPMGSHAVPVAEYDWQHMQSGTTESETADVREQMNGPQSVTTATRGSRPRLLSSRTERRSTETATTPRLTRRLKRARVLQCAFTPGRDSCSMRHMRQMNVLTC